ncbi:DUF3042 family protein [Bombilactobacillus thymidiniphilus]|uniref:DUF3042 family protein n=1 Tax=Bombilactobacillus thymidiniphilus TaxID=2923363 RepID=A0ABY4PC98_9LACO|nr:DUF3042 family protein [Bombilactobacillus thymidiniphilus]UQS83390.1 DUF3042 family protein [Bombilactobacillus thymidiniphilus]
MTSKSGMISGIVVGAIVTAGAAVGSALMYRQKTIKPIKKQDNRIAENRKKANRKAHSAQSINY